MFKEKKTIFSIFILLIIALLIYRRWVSFDIFTSGDWPYYLSNTFSSFPFTYTWLNLNDMGYTNLILWRSILASVQSIIAGFGYGSNISEKVLIFWPTIIFANIFSFFLFKKILKSNIGAVMGSIVFNYNTYYLTASSAFLLYSASPWVLLSLLIFIKALETGKKYLYAVSGLTLFIVGSYDFRVAYIGIMLLFFYSFYYFFFIKNLNISIKSLKILFSSFILFFVFGLLNIYWILPMIKLGTLTSNFALDRGLFGNEFLNILYSITIFHPFWTGIKPAWFTVEPIMLYFWLIPIFAFLGFYLNRKNKNILFFGIVALVGVFLTKQIAHPFTGIYPWFYNHLPGFNAFREASKFYFLVALGYSILIGAFVSYIFDNFKKIKIYFKYAFVIFIALLFLWNIKSVITGQISGIFVPRHIPTDYILVNNLILKDKDYYRTLWIPTITTWGMYTTNHPELNMGAMLGYYDYWTNYVYEPYSYGKRMMKLLNLPFSNNLLDISSVKYVIVPLIDTENDGDFFFNFSEKRQFYVNQLNKISWLQKINIGTQEVVVYRNENFRSYIYATQHEENIKDLEPIIYDVKYKFVNPTEYKFSIKNVKSVFYFNLAENYHSQWSLRIGSFNWVDVLTKKNYFVDSKNHLRNDAGLNSFAINPQEICKRFVCKQNKDRSYNISGTLYFVPQSYMYLGLIISGGTLFAVLSYLLFILGKNLYERKNK